MSRQDFSCEDKIDCNKVDQAVAACVKIENEGSFVLPPTQRLVSKFYQGETTSSSDFNLQRCNNIIINRSNNIVNANNNEGNNNSLIKTEPAVHLEQDLHMISNHSVTDIIETKGASNSVVSDLKEDMSAPSTNDTVAEETCGGCTHCACDTRKEKDIKKKHSNIYFELYMCKHCKCKLHLNLEYNWAGNSDSFMCSHCRSQVGTKSQLSAHLKRVHNVMSRLYDCFTCEYKANKKDHIKSHLYLKHSQVFVGIECLYCDHYSKMFGGLRKHEWQEHSEHSKMYKCSFCAYTTRRKNHIKAHMRVRHDETCKLFNCLKCEYKSKTRDNLKRHMNSKHNDSNEIYKCFNCGYKTSNKDALKRHVKDHSSSFKWYICVLCQYKTKKKDYFAVHKKIKHSIDGRYSCGYCGYQANNNMYFKRHMKFMHKLFEKFKCTRCDYQTKRKDSLKRHEVYLHDLPGRMFSCKMCSFKGRKWEYSRHLNVVHDKKAHKKLRNKKKLRTVLEDGDMQNSCSVCLFQADSEVALEEHPRIMHDNDAQGHLKNEEMVKLEKGVKDEKSSTGCFEYVGKVENDFDSDNDKESVQDV